MNSIHIILIIERSNKSLNTHITIFSENNTIIYQNSKNIAAMPANDDKNSDLLSHIGCYALSGDYHVTTSLVDVVGRPIKKYDAVGRTYISVLGRQSV